VITYLWVIYKLESKKAKEILEAIIIDDSTTRYRRRDGDYPNRDYFIPLREYYVSKKQDFLPKKRMKVHKLDQGIRKQTFVGPGVHTKEVDHSIIVTADYWIEQNLNQNEDE